MSLASSRYGGRRRPGSSLHELQGWNERIYRGLYMYCTGGTESTINVGGVNYRVHDFTTSGVLKIHSLGVDPTVGRKLEFMGVAGGSSGGPTNACGGGSCGEFAEDFITLVTIGDLIVVVPAGGAFSTSVSGNPGGDAAFYPPGVAGKLLVGGGRPSDSTAPAIGYAAGDNGAGGSMNSGLSTRNRNGKWGGRGNASSGGGGAGWGSSGLDGSGVGGQGGGPTTSSLRTGAAEQYAAGGGGSGGTPPYGGPAGAPAAGDGTLGTDHANGDGAANYGHGGGGVYTFGSESGRGSSGRWTFRYRIV